MSRRFGVLALGVLGLAVLTGCSPTYPKCDSDEQCKSHNEVCVNGQCQECATDANCKAGFVCQGNKCTPKPECTTDQNCPAGSTCANGKCAPKACTADADNWNPVHFAFNESALTAEARTQLNELSDCIKKGNLKKVTLEGHADERGTEEYNLQLSNRRAASVRKYLVDLGVAPTKLDTVGYGENRPAVEGHNEEAWAANRRVEFRH